MPKLQGTSVDFNFFLRPVALAAGIMAAGLSASSAAHAQAAAQALQIDIPSLPADQALQRLVETTKLQLVFSPDVVRGVKSNPVSGTMTPRDALAKLLEGSGIQIVDTGPGAATLRPTRAAAEVDEPAAASLQSVIVTARKQAERMMDVPIPMTALIGEALRQRVAQSVDEALQDAPGVAALSA